MQSTYKVPGTMTNVVDSSDVYRLLPQVGHDEVKLSLLLLDFCDILCSCFYFLCLSYIA